ncbi:hypothetical protein EIN_008870 [Entamoeba invadens IP1]|uniref:Ras n=1 Tax=Entamoeba invadens IP1 TaxID=370355 RepID=A0A0A1TYP2_ENTIV|nr:hypothetical protein EIN_008870 [Entamoeba invadens IP1]ELP83651.1 hypothetical protein EIN_008870 [Entamoeba invadens IP1]|eukprot:XP_004182997.1 hypothetical protein EIN_008870 [Entamoeba invadens IP1]
MSPIRIVMLGCMGVGKSTIIVQLVINRFLELYDPTIEDTYRTRISIDREAVLIEVVDTVSAYEYPGCYDKYIKSSDGFVIVYSITSYSSFVDADFYRKEVYNAFDGNFSKHIPIVLCGNKCDLEFERQVCTIYAKNVVDEWKILFYETSAKNNTNITEMFQVLVEDIKEKKQY